MNDYEKYLKYKLKYIELKEKLKYNNQNDTYLLNQNGGNLKFKCHPNNDFSKICEEVSNGQYKSKESCINDCETKYINIRLKKTKIHFETTKFYLFIKDIIKNKKISVYIKGGNVIGLIILKIMLDKFKSDDEQFIKCFNEFLKLDLIKDWDFVAYTLNNKTITTEYRDNLDKIASKYKLVPRAKTFILYQTQYPIKIDDKALFEIAIIDSDAFSKLEIPMTTMKIKINEYNLKYIFMFASSFLTYNLKKKPFDIVLLKHILNKIEIQIHPHKNGLYNVENNFDSGGLGDKIVNFIKDFSKLDLNLAQMLCTHIEDPYRILYRLPEKNILKTEKIKSFISKILQIKETPEWLINTQWITKMIKLFSKKLGKKLNKIYKEKFHETNSLKETFLIICEFLQGINFNRTLIEYNNFKSNGLTILKLIFKPLVKTIGESIILKLNDDDECKIINVIKFLINKKLFQ